MRSLIATTLFTLITTSLAPLALADQRFAQPPPSRLAQADVGADYFEPEAIVVDRVAVRAALVTNRTKNLAAFRIYQRNGMFPSNTHDNRGLNVWRDRDGKFCAAATIIRMSGGTALADKVAEQNNFIKLGDVKQGPVMDWILTSGFTQDEIAAIQEPFMPVAREPMPTQIAPDLRAAENQRLATRYRAVDQMIVKNHAASLDAAVERLMKNRELARTLVEATSAS